jgi:hypothetical protein
LLGLVAGVVWGLVAPMTESTCIYNITRYTWKITNPFPHRLRLGIRVWPGYERELRTFFAQTGDVKIRVKGAGSLEIDRPRDVAMVATMLGATPGVVRALNAYAASWANAKKGTPVTPDLRMVQAGAARQVMLLLPSS